MPRCLMAKKWKAYPWADRETGSQILEHGESSIRVNEEDEEEIDVVGDATNNCNASSTCWAPIPAPSTWGPSSPTAGATAPSPPPAQSSVDMASRIAVLYNDNVHDSIQYTTYLSQPYHEDASRKTYTNLQNNISQQRPPVLVTTTHPTSSSPIPKWSEKRYQVLSSLENKSEIVQDASGQKVILVSPTQDKSFEPNDSEKCEEVSPDQESQVKEMKAKTVKKSLSMCFTSTGAALSLPPKKKDIYRPYSLDDRPTVVKPKPRLVTPSETEESKQNEIQPVSLRYESENLGLTVGQMVEVRETAPVEVVPMDAHMYELQPEYTPRDQVLCKRIDQENYYEVRSQKEGYAENDADYRRDEYYRGEDRNYRYEERPFDKYSRPAEDISAAHAILDLSASTTIFPTSVQETNQNNLPVQNADRVFKVSTPVNKTVAYTYEAFVVSDGRSKKKPTGHATSDSGGSQDGNDNKTKYTCTECGKQYATSSNLSRHKQTHRSLDSQSAKKCMTCGKAYVSMPALAMHLLTHKLSHGCGVCGKLFSRPWLLQGHLRSHTGEKPYGCAHCGKAFADRSNLRAHMQTHSIDKNYVCTRCNKSFALKSYLNKHLESACFKETPAKDGETSSGLDVSPLTPPQSPSPVYSYSL